MAVLVTLLDLPLASKTLDEYANSAVVLCLHVWLFFVPRCDEFTVGTKLPLASPSLR